MTGTCIYKAYVTLSVIFSASLPALADNNEQNSSTFKYGYVIPHNDGSTQAHLESRDGNFALGRYYVSLQNGTGQKVTYFADDLGFHSGVFYFSQNGKASSKTHIAMGHKALATFGNRDAQSDQIVSNSPTLLFGKRLLKSVITTVVGKPGFTKLNYTPIPGGFYLTHEALDVSNVTEHPLYFSGRISAGFTPQGTKYSDNTSQIKANTQTFYQTTGNMKDEIKQLHIQSTTPSIKTYSPTPQEVPNFSKQTTQFQQHGQKIKVSSLASNLNDVGYSKEKSIEKTSFADIDAQIISEVQKHAEQIILKDLQNRPNVNLNAGFATFSSNSPRLTTIAMQPIVVTNIGETGLKAVHSTTATPFKKSNKDLQPESINAITITGKNADELLQNSEYYRISLLPSFTASINASQPPHQTTDVTDADRNSNLNNFTLCNSNLCEKDNQIFTVDLNAQKDVEGQGSEVTTDTGANKVIHTFYPENKQQDERHYITTIDVQKAISLEMPQNEDGSIRLAQNFAFNKIKPLQQNQQSYQTSSQPVYNSISITKGLSSPKTNQNVGPPHKPYLINTVTTAPELLDITSNRNLPVLQEYNDVSQTYESRLQERIENDRLSYEDQLAVPAPPVYIPTDQTDDLTQVEKNIQELRQKILSNIDAQHEEEQRKQSLVEEERKQYFENLKKVEALKDQNPYNLQANTIQATAAPVSSEVMSNVEPVPKAEYSAAQQIQDIPIQSARFEPATQIQYDTSPQTYQTEIKGYSHEIAVPQAITQSVNLDEYQKQDESFNAQNVQTPNEQQYNFYESQGSSSFPVDNNIQQSISAYTAKKVQPYVSNIAQAPLQERYETSQVVQSEEKQQLQQFVAEQLNAVPVNFAQPVLPQNNKISVAKTFLLNNIGAFDYSRLLQVKHPISLHQMYSVPLQTESKLLPPPIYQVPQSIPVSVQIPQYKFLVYPDVPSASDKQYYSTLIQKLPNKLRVQPLKPSLPSEDNQKEAVRNLLSQPQFHQTYIYPGVSFNNRLQLRHTRKNQISSSDQVRSQSVRRSKSLKNLRIEYGFKPPLRPSVEFTEEVKPSVYGSSIKPE